MIPRSRTGFTLIELLVVIAVIAVLIGILIPSVARGRDIAMQLKCLSDQRSQGIARALYAHDNNDHIMTTKWRPEQYSQARSLFSSPPSASTLSELPAVANQFRNLFRRGIETMTTEVVWPNQGSDDFHSFGWHLQSPNGGYYNGGFMYVHGYLDSIESLWCTDPMGIAGVDNGFGNWQGIPIEPDNPDFGMDNWVEPGQWQFYNDGTRDTSVGGSVGMGSHYYRDVFVLPKSWGLFRSESQWASSQRQNSRRFKDEVLAYQYLTEARLGSNTSNHAMQWCPIHSEGGEKSHGGLGWNVIYADGSGYRVPYYQGEFEKFAAFTEEFVGGGGLTNNAESSKVWRGLHWGYFDSRGKDTMLYESSLLQTPRGR